MWELAVLGVIVVVVGAMYNGLVRLREQADGAWADIDVQLKRRWDLIPNVVETVKGYASHEQETLDAVIQARSRAMGAGSTGELQAAEGQLAGALKSLFALAENYPDLKAAGGFRDLQGQLAELEGSLGKARQYYNAVVRDFNTKVQQVPTNLVARTFGFRERDFFEVEAEARTAPRVDFGSEG